MCQELFATTDDEYQKLCLLVQLLDSYADIDDEPSYAERHPDKTLNMLYISRRIAKRFLL